MKVKEIAKTYLLDASRFEQYVLSHWVNRSDVDSGLMGTSVNNDIEGYVKRYKAYIEEEDTKDAARVKEEREKEAARQREAAARAMEEAIKQEKVRSVLITSSNSLEGYKISRYSDYISADGIVSVNRGTYGAWFSDPTNVSSVMSSYLAQIRAAAIDGLKSAANMRGCNAVIGVQFNYITLSPETATASGGTAYLPYVWGVTASGTAVEVTRETV